MTGPPRPARRSPIVRWVLAVFLVTVLLFIAILHEPIANLVFTTVVPSRGRYRGQEILGWKRVKRWTAPPEWVEAEHWYAETGLRSHRISYTNNKPSRATLWEPDGRVSSQYWQGDPEAGRKEGSHPGPPWLWGEQDQTEPTAPWTRRDLTAQEWWDRMEKGEW